MEGFLLNSQVKDIEKVVKIIDMEMSNMFKEYSKFTKDKVNWFDMNIIVYLSWNAMNIS